VPSSINGTFTHWTPEAATDGDGEGTDDETEEATDELGNCDAEGGLEDERNVGNDGTGEENRPWIGREAADAPGREAGESVQAPMSPTPTPPRISPRVRTKPSTSQRPNFKIMVHSWKIKHKSQKGIINI